MARRAIAESAAADCLTRINYSWAGTHEGPSSRTTGLTTCDITVANPTVFTPAQNALLTTPPSTRSAAPVVADASGLATYATSDATSSGFANRLISDVGRTF